MHVLPSAVLAANHFSFSNDQLIICKFLNFVIKNTYYLNLKDVLFVDSGDPWNPHPATVEKVMKMLHEIHRVLKPEGIFISITFGQVVSAIFGLFL